MAEIDDLHAPSNERLLTMLPREQWDSIVNGERLCDIEPDFLGFVGIYERLAQIIPTSWTVVDLGCAYAPQAFYFQNHRAYVGVDLLTPVEQRFAARNSQHFFMPISEFLETRLKDFKLDSTFAVCSYVPPWHDDNMALARGAFKNVFTYYPSREETTLIIPTREPN